MEALRSGVSSAGLVELQAAVSAYLEQDPVRLSDADQLTELRALEQLSRQLHAATSLASRHGLLLYVEDEWRSDDGVSFRVASDKRKAQRRQESRFDRVVLSAADPAWLRDVFGGVSASAHRRSRSCNSLCWYGQSACRVGRSCQWSRVGF